MSVNKISNNSDHKQKGEDSFRLVLVAFREALEKLYKMAPVFWAFVLSLVVLCLKSLVQYFSWNFLIIFIIVFYFFLISFASYFKNNSYIETTVIFATGLFTAFSIEWTNDKFALFILSALLLTIMVFLTDSIKLASLKEQILVQSENNYPKSFGVEKNQINQAWEQCELIKYKSLLKLQDRYKMFIYLTACKVRPENIPFIFEKLIKLVVIKQVDPLDTVKAVTNVYLIAHVFKEDFKLKIDAFTGALMSSILSPEQFMTEFNNHFAKLISGDEQFSDVILELSGINYYIK
jgi:hypothetical protein